jgi:hypothetical protein
MGVTMEHSMQQLHLSSGKTHCQYCGDHVAVNRLSAHINARHPRPIMNTAPTLVRAPKSTK